MVVAVLHLEQVEVVGLPVTLGSFGPHHIVVGLDLQVVVLEVLVRHHVVVAGRRERDAVVGFLKVRPIDLPRGPERGASLGAGNGVFAYRSWR